MNTHRYFLRIVLSRAAPQLGHILLKRLGSQLQAFYLHQVGEEHIAQIGNGKAIFQAKLHGQRRRLDNLTAFRGQHVRAQQAVAVPVGHPLNQAASVAGRQGAGTVLQRPGRSFYILAAG